MAIKLYFGKNCSNVLAKNLFANMKFALRKPERKYEGIFSKEELTILTFSDFHPSRPQPNMTNSNFCALVVLFR